jgi:hypothetical protein
MLSKTLQLGAAGNAGGKKVYVDDVFSTYLYEGNDTDTDIVNGIDLTEGGLVWIKSRQAGQGHRLVDSEWSLSANQYIDTSSTTAPFTGPVINSFNTNGFNLDSNWYGNSSNSSYGGDFTSWTFRKCPGFFDVVTYTGNSTAGRTVSHNLGSVPGMIWIKKTSGTGSWMVYHRSTGNSNALLLQQNNAAFSSPVFNNTTPTSTEFTLNNGGAVNGSGSTYVAYLFAHDDQSFGTDEDEAIIKCGSYTGNGSSYGTFQDLGFEPQWILVKPSNVVTDHWSILDNIRGVVTGAPSNGTDKPLHPNTNSSEQSDELIEFNATGFTPRGSDSKSNASSVTYIYVAIRRPHKPPEAGTDVFNSVARSGTGTDNLVVNTTIQPDLIIQTYRNSAAATDVWDRLRGAGRNLQTQSSNAEGNNAPSYGPQLFGNTSYQQGTLDRNNYNSNGNTFIDWIFRRAPGFFDVVAYTGTGSATTISHNLGVAPELMIVKRRNTTGNWQVYSSGLTSAAYKLNLDTSTAESILNDWNSTDPTSSVFSLGTAGGVNASGGTYINYLFASLDGISKVGSYTGTGNNLSVNCGFAAGARFVLIKRTDSSGDWWVFDTSRGIVSNGNDPALRLNSANAEVTSTDYLEPNSNGFTVTSTAGAGLNANGGTYLYLAIA